MTANTACTLACDHADVSGETTTYRKCPEVVTDGTDGNGPRTDGLPERTYLFTKADARREARKLGWATAVRSDGSRGRGAQLDFCAAHRDPDVRAQACAEARARLLARAEREQAAR